MLVINYYFFVSGIYLIHDLHFSFFPFILGSLLGMTMGQVRVKFDYTIPVPVKGGASLGLDFLETGLEF